MKAFIQKYADWIAALAIAVALSIIYLCLAGCGAVRPLPPKSVFSMGSDGDTNAVLVWLTAMSILGIGASVAAAIFLPIKKLAVAAGCGFAAVLVMALTVKAALPILPWIALAIGVMAVIALVILFRKYVLGLHAAVGFGCDMSKAQTDDDAQLVKHTHAIDQANKGIKGIIDQALSEFKK